MSSILNIPPALYGGDPTAHQQGADLQYFYQRHLLPEVLRFDLGNLAATGIISLARVPWKRGQVIAVRTYAYSAGSGAYTADVLWLDSTGTSHSIFAVAGDRIVSRTASGRLVEKVPTANVLVDPFEITLEGRFYVNITAFSGTAWTAVVLEVVLTPVSRS